MTNQFNLENMRDLIDQIWAKHDGISTSNEDREVLNDHMSQSDDELAAQLHSTEILGSQSHRTHIASTSQAGPTTCSFQSEQINIAMMIEHVDSTPMLTEYGKRLILYKAKTPDGSRFLQNAIMKDIRKKNMLYEAVIHYMFDVMMDESGTLVFARLVHYCDHLQLEALVQKLTRNTRVFVAVLCNKNGAQSVKKLIKVLETSQLVGRIVSLIGVEFARLITNRTASHVIIKCFDVLNSEQNKELCKLLINHCIEFATHEIACLALNESLNYLRQPYRGQLCNSIAMEARFLSQDPIGNYVVQKVLEIHNATLNQKICSSLKGCFVDFSTQKASSHVVEKCLECEFGMEYILQDFLEFDKLWRIAGNQYGNYVIQKALKTAKRVNSPYYPALVEKLYKDKEKFQNGYGKNVYVMITEGLCYCLVKV